MRLSAHKLQGRANALPKRGPFDASAGSAQAGTQKDSPSGTVRYASSLARLTVRGGQGTVPTLPALRPGGHRRTPWAEQYLSNRGVGAPRRSCKNGSRPAHVRERPGALAGASPSGAIVARVGGRFDASASSAQALRQAQRRRFGGVSASRDAEGQPSGTVSACARPTRPSLRLRGSRRLRLTDDPCGAR